MATAPCRDCGDLRPVKPHSRRDAAGNPAPLCRPCAQRRPKPVRVAKPRQPRRTAPCVRCGKAMYSAPTSAPPDRRMCHPCRRSRQPNEVRRQCRQCGGTVEPRSAYCTTHRVPRDRTWITCAWCGVAKVSYRGIRFCSRLCAFAVDGQSVAVPWAQCVACLAWHTGQQRRRFDACSERCEEEAKAVLLAPRPFREVECSRCGTEFITNQPRQRVCSTRCSRKESKLRRKARSYNALGEWRWSDFMRIARKFDYCCAYCGEKPDRLDPDHVVPLARSGANATSNLLPACPPCNSDKSALTLPAWAASRAARGLPPVRTTWAPNDPRFMHLTEPELRAVLVAA